MGCTPSCHAEGFSRRIKTVAENLNALTRDIMVCAPTSCSKETNLMTTKRRYQDYGSIFDAFELEFEKGIEIDEAEILKKTYTFNRV
jgi:hypothetical protein